MEQQAEKAARPLDPRHVPALDGLRAIAILIIAWYHIWQQSWLIPVVPTPFLAGLGLRELSLDVVPRTGYLLVDFLLLLSAFCLFLPHARAMLLGEPVPTARDFYRRRAARILPPYLLSVILLFLYTLATGAYAERGLGFAFRDLLASLTFTQTLFKSTFFHTQINGVLWTAAIEVQFYLLFPWLAAAFRKKPFLTYLGMVAVSVLYLRGFALRDPEGLRLTLNQLPGFFAVFANGMALALLYVWITKRTGERPWLAAAAAAGLALGLILFNRLEHGAAGAEITQVFQAQYRFLLSLTFSLLLLSVSVGGRAFRAVLGNRVLRFFAAISYNLYIWHQWLAVRLKEWRIPYWPGDELPNFTGNRPWQQQYTLLSFLCAVGVAALLTYAFERPMARRILKITETKENPS